MATRRRCARRSDFDAGLRCFFPDAVWEVQPLASSFEGIPAIRSFVEDWIGNYDEYRAGMIDRVIGRNDIDEARAAAEEFIDAGDSVVAFIRMKTQGRGSGVEVERSDAQVWTLRSGTAVRGDYLNDRQEALKSVGL